jgi:hypothetical protein
VLFDLFELSQIGLPVFQLGACVENHVDNGARYHDAFEESDSPIHDHGHEEDTGQCTHVEPDSEQTVSPDLFSARI